MDVENVKSVMYVRLNFYTHEPIYSLTNIYIYICVRVRLLYICMYHIPTRARVNNKYIYGRPHRAYLYIYNNNNIIVDLGYNANVCILYYFRHANIIT